MDGLGALNRRGLYCAFEQRHRDWSDRDPSAVYAWRSLAFLEGTLGKDLQSPNLNAVHPKVAVLKIYRPP